MARYGHCWCIIKQVVLSIHYKLGAATSNDGGVAANSNTWGDGYGIGLTADTDMGLTVGAYYATRENKNHNNVADVNDETTWYMVC